MRYIDWDNQDPEEGKDDPLCAKLEHERRMTSLREFVRKLQRHKPKEYEYDTN